MKQVSEEIDRAGNVPEHAGTKKINMWRNNCFLYTPNRAVKVRIHDDESLSTESCRIFTYTLGHMRRRHMMPSTC